MKQMILSVVGVLFLLTACDYLSLTPQERFARTTIKQRFRRSIEGDSYKPIAWGNVEFRSPWAGTGTQSLFSDETGTPPSEYSMTHRLRMRNGFGMEMTYDIRVFFADENCTSWVGMEYMDDNDPGRRAMEK